MLTKMEKQDASQLTEFPRFESEPAHSGVITFFNKLLKLPLFSPGETTENAQPNQTKNDIKEDQIQDQAKNVYEEIKSEVESYSIELDGRSLPNVLKRISNLVAVGSGGETRYADTELAQYWMPDDISKECYECAARFSTLRRKHHCRVCGVIFCSRCCSQRVPGQIFNCAGGLRVCNYCCNIVLSYLREKDMTGEISPDLRTLQENLQVKFPENKWSAQNKAKDNFMFARQQDDRADSRPTPKEALQDVFRQLSFTLPTQQHRYRLVRYNSVWRGCDILQWIMDNTNNKTRAQASQICQSFLNEGYMECVTELPKFADYALYKPIIIPPVIPDEDSPEENNRFVESVSSYCLDLNLSDSSARLIKAPKSETKHSPSSEEDNLIIERTESLAETKILCKAVAESGEDHLKLLMRQCLARENLSCGWLDILLPLCQHAADVTMPDVNSNDIDVRNYVQVKKVPGGTMRDSRWVPGIVLTKNVAHRNMPQELQNPSVLLLDCPIAYQRVEGKLTSLEPLLMQEQEYLSRCAARISALHPKIVLVRGSAARAVQDALRAEGVALATNVREAALRRVARCVRADIVTSIDARIGIPKLGTCTNFYVQNYSSKTLMVLEGCAEPQLGCSILLRGSSLQELVRVKRVVKFMLLACYNWKLEKSFLKDIEAILPEPGMGFDEHCSQDPDPTEKSFDTKSVESLNDKTDVNDPLQTPEPKNYSRKIDSDKTLSCGVPIRDNSDPLRARQLSVDDEVFLPSADTKLKADIHNDRWSTDDTVLSMSPNVVIPAPYLETEAGRKCPLRQYFHDPLFPPPRQRTVLTPKTLRRKISKHSEDDQIYFKELHPFLLKPITTSADDLELKALLANFRATGCRIVASAHRTDCPMYKPCFIRKSPQKEAESDQAADKQSEPPDPLAPENHQKLSLLWYSYSNKSPNVPDFCVNPWIATMEMYGRQDISLGAFLEKFCFNEDYKCSSSNCHIPMNQHVRRFVHGDGCVTVTCNTIGHSSADRIDEEQSQQIMFWSRCSDCSASSHACHLSKNSLSLSLAKYLELRIRALRYQSAASCQHPIHAHAHYFAKGLTTVCFRYNKITTWDIELPPAVISTDYDIQEMREELIAQVNDLMLKGHETFTSLSESEAEREYTAFKQHMETIHLGLTSTALQQHTTLAGVVKGLWSVRDRVVAGEKMLRDAHDKWAGPPPTPAPAKPSTKSAPENGNADDKSDVEDSIAGDSGISDNADSQSKNDSEHQGTTEEDEEKGDKKTVRQILSQLLSNNQPSNQNGVIISGGLLPVVVFAGEIGSVVAATLASVQYQRQLHSLLVNGHQSEQEDVENSTSASRDKVDSDKTKAKSNEHIEVLLKDGLLCRVYYAAQFHRLRAMLLASLSDQSRSGVREHSDKEPPPKPSLDDCKNLSEIEEGFVRSLSRSVAWAARGGKSGSTFCKTTDDRYVLKEMSKPEWQQFLEFAPHYFSYVTSCHQNKLPSLLARIVGVYSVGGAGNGVLVMENLFYGRDISRRFDLKGSLRHRLAPDANAAGAVLMDENLLNLRWESQFYLASHTASVVWAGVERDTAFLAANCVMDYSLLLGLDGGKLVVGIIDYIRTFTWDKKLEHYVKKNLGSGQPTVVSPEQYRRRFVTAMKKYFLHCPTQWDDLHRGLIVQTQ